MTRERAENKPRVNHRNKYLRRVLRFVGGLDTFAEEVKRSAEEDHLFTLAQAARLSRRLSSQLTPEEAKKAQDAFMGSARLLTADHLKQNYVSYTERDVKILNAANVIDTALDDLSGRFPVRGGIHDNQ